MLCQEELGRFALYLEPPSSEVSPGVAQHSTGIKGKQSLMICLKLKLVQLSLTHDLKIKTDTKSNK